MTLRLTYRPARPSRANGRVARVVAIGAIVALSGGIALSNASASDGDPLVLGTSNVASNPTQLSSSSDTFRIVSGGTGINSVSNSATGSAVLGLNATGGVGVLGRAAGGGVAVVADSSDGVGVALRTTGKLQLQNRSGVAIVATGQSTVTVNLFGVTSSSMVLATVQQSGKYFVRSAVPANTSFTITLNKKAKAPDTVKVAWLVLN